MYKDHIYIKLLINNNISLNNIKLVLKDENNKIIDKQIINNYDIYIPNIIDKKIYKLYIYFKGIKKVILYAVKNKTYNICINDNNKKKNNITILLKDYNYPDNIIKKGEITLWQ